VGIFEADEGILRVVIAVGEVDAELLTRRKGRGKSMTASAVSSLKLLSLPISASRHEPHNHCAPGGQQDMSDRRCVGISERRNRAVRLLLHCGNAGNHGLRTGDSA